MTKDACSSGTRKTLKSGFYPSSFSTWNGINVRVVIALMILTENRHFGLRSKSLFFSHDSAQRNSIPFCSLVDIFGKGELVDSEKIAKYANEKMNNVCFVKTKQ